MAEKGTLVLDCGDEKHLWLDALFPWLITSGPRIKESSVLHTSSSSMASTSPAGGGGGGGGALGGRLGSEIFVAEQGIIIDSKGRGVQQIMTSSLSTAAAAMIGAMTIGGVEDVKGSSSSQGIAAVAANAKKLHLATSDLMRAFTASHSLPSNSNTSACNSKSKFGSGISVVNIEAPDTPFMSLTEIDRRSSTSAAKSVTPPLIREVTLVPSSSKRTFSNAKTTSNGNRLMDIEDEANADALEDYSGVLDLLDAVKYPLSNTKTFLQDALDLSQKVHMDTTSCFRSALQGVTQAVIGLSFLRTLADEVMERIEHEKVGRRSGIR